MFRIIQYAVSCFAIAAALGIAATVITLTHTPTRSVTFLAPQPCYVDGDHDWLPSGDAARFDDGHTAVCTDGVWVRVTGYGQP